MATYTVKQGDTLSEIAWKYNSTYNYGSNVTEAYKRLADINDIDNPNLIYVGQVLKLDNPKDSSGNNATVKKKTNTTSSVVAIKQFGLQSGTDRTVFATWAWDKSNTDHYQVIWYYDTGNGVWFVGEDTTTTYKYHVYAGPTNAKRVRVKIKPVSKKHKVKGKETSYWTGKWCSVQTYSFSNNPPSKPNAPTVTIEKYTLTASLSNLGINATEIEFQVIKNDASVSNTGKAKIVTASASYSCSIAAGNKYKVRCRGRKNGVYGEWSDYSDNYSTIPSSPQQITSLKALSSTSVAVVWKAVSDCTSYELEYTTNKSYFDSNPNEVKKVTIESVTALAEVTGLESGQEYFFRVRAVNARGNSSWSGIKSIIIGKAPSAPTTWSSTTTVISGDPLILYWVHNSEDGSSQTRAELELTIDGVTTKKTIRNTTAEDEKDKTSSYSVDTSAYTEGSTIQWRVRTAGITDTYGDWSVQRIVDIYAPATLELIVTDANGTILSTLNTFPLYVKATAGPVTQTPLSYHLSVIADSSYETVDQIGNTKFVSEGDSVYSSYFDTSEELLVELSAGNVDLENNVSYTMVCTVAMDSGLRAEARTSFDVAWTDELYEPNAEFTYDEETYAAHLRPYCTDEEENLVGGVTLAVYRREYDGGFVEIAKGLENSNNTYVTDPHPALDYARYRIVATSEETGAVSYYDMPGYPIGESSAIIQWEEQWSSFDVSSEDEADETQQPTWAGSLVRLPYNLDTSEKADKDVSLVEYIGRKRPVSYYGTQLGEGENWKVEIVRDDVETLYALRRLKIWNGDVYVREPSGSGYWASISVSFSQTHCELTIPVTIDIVRVEGGV